MPIGRGMRIMARITRTTRRVVEPALLQQRLDRRQPAAEGLVGLRRIAQVSRAVDEVAQAFGGRPIEDVAGFLEGLEGVGVEHLRPQIGVVGRRVAAAGEQMLEMRQAVAHDDLRRHGDAREALALELGDVEAGRLLQRMNVEIDQRAGGVFHRGEALVEGAAGEQPLEQRLRHRLAGLAVPGIGFQDLRHLQPVLVKLRGQFDEVARHRGAGEQRIGHIGQEAVQRMAEFVEQRARVVEGEQRRLAGGGLGEIADIDDDRVDIAGELFLVAQRGHPGARVLGGAGEIVADEQADMVALAASLTSQARASG